MTEMIEWDEKVEAWVNSNGKVIAPRLDSDGWDYFFVRNKSDPHAVARWCSGEDYWAFYCIGDLGSTEVTEEEREFAAMVLEISRSTLRPEADGLPVRWAKWVLNGKQ